MHGEWQSRRYDFESYKGKLDQLKLYRVGKYMKNNYTPIANKMLGGFIAQSPRKLLIFVDIYSEPCIIIVKGQPY